WPVPGRSRARICGYRAPATSATWTRTAVALLVGGEREGQQELARIRQGIPTGVLAQKLALGRSALGETNDLRLERVGGPDVSAGRDDDALHLADLAAEIIALRRRE